MNKHCPDGMHCQSSGACPQGCIRFPSSAPPTGSAAADLGLRQTIYEHGGSRIWVERDGTRDLMADTYGNVEYAKAVRDFTEKWLRQNAAANAAERSKDRG